MWYSIMKRESILRVLQGREIESVEKADKGGVQLPNIGPKEFVLVWPVDVSGYARLPSAVVCGEQEARDLYAWASSYSPAISPITSFCRVLLPELAECWFSRSDLPQLDDLEGLALSLILAEAFCLHGGEPKLEELTPTGAAKLYSFSLARAHALQLLDAHLGELHESWTSVGRKQVGAYQEKIETSLFTAWMIAAYDITDFSSLSGSQEVGGEFGTISEAIRQLRGAGSISGDVWKRLTKGRSSIGDCLAEDQTREAKVAKTEKAIDALLGLKAATFSDEFAVGYLVSRIAPGTFDHLNLLEGLVGHSSSVPVWYAMCAGLQPESRVVGFGEGRGLRILREVLRNDDSFDSPRADVSYSEFKAASEVKDYQPRYLTNSKGLLAVELLPGIVKYVSHGNEKRERQGEMFGSAEEQTVSSVLPKLDEASKLLSAIRSALLKTNSRSAGETQAGKSSRKRKGRKK